RKHLQYFVIHQWPTYLIPVMNMMLAGTTSRVLYPALWNDLLLSFGLYLPTSKLLSTEEMISEFKKYSVNQPLFTASDIYEILRLFASHLQRTSEYQNLDLIDY